MADTISPDQMESCRSINLSLISSSVHKYVNYSKQMQIRLAELNDNVSSVIKESCTGIDSICNRVRQCLFEMDQKEKTMYLTDEVTEYEIIDEDSKSIEEESQVNEEMSDCSSAEEITQENENINRENINIEKEPEVENIQQTITPFFTVINNCQNEDNSSKTECRKQVMTKTIYSLMNDLQEESCLNLPEESASEINLDRFKETVSTLCDNFDMMNKLVENINKEIEQFSQTAIVSNDKSLETIASDEKSLEVIDKKEGKTNTPILKPIKRLSKSNSRQKSIQVDDCFSENEIDLEMMELNNRDSESFIIPDVYRKRAFTDLYERLLAQIEANDSLVFFQTLMKRQKKMEKKSNKNFISQMKLNVPAMNYSVPQKSVTNTVNQRRSSKKLDIDKKYPGSLWFSQKHAVKEKSASRSSSGKSSRRDVNTANKKGSKAIENKTEYAYAPPQKPKSRTKKTKMSDSVKSLSPTKRGAKFSSGANVTRQTCSLECTCNMVVKNEMPPSPSTKCHLQWLRAKPKSVEKIKFLDILDDLTARDLLPLQSEYPRRDNQGPRELDYKDIQDTYLYKLIYGKQLAKNAWKQLIDPSLVQTKKNNSSSKTPRTSPKKNKEEKNNDSFMEKFCTQNYSKCDIIKKLSPYIFDPDRSEDRCIRSVIVMPVRVYYDNSKPNEAPTRLKIPNKPPVGNPKKIPVTPTKESKPSKKGDVSPSGISKPVKVVFDGLQNKPQSAITTKIVKPSIIPSNVPANSARLNSEKNQVDNAKSRSFSPTSFASYCQDITGVKKETTDLKQRQDNIAAYSKIQAEFNKIKQTIYTNKFTHNDKRLWASKYGKSVGQQLISYVQHQDAEAIKQQPKYAIPRLNIRTNSPEKKNIAGFLKEVNPHRQILSHVRNLKTKNDEIQDNIKKAIDVIESQMVDILKNDSNSVEAFDIMEKEIMDVLSLMKCNDNQVLQTIPSKPCTPKDKIESSQDLNSLEKDYKIISEHLFDRLQHILDKESSVPTTPTEGCNKRKHNVKKDKEDTRKKQKLSSSKRTKVNILSSSTSASMDEKKNVKRFSRLNTKKTEKKEVKSKSVDRAEPVITQNWDHVCGDQNINKTVHIESEISVVENEVKLTTEHQLWDNSEGDFTNQSPGPELFYDVETDNTYDVSDDANAEKLLTADEIQTLNEIATFVKNTEADLSADMDLIKDESNTAIENVEKQNSDVNVHLEDFIIDELDKAIEKAETLTVAPDSGLTKHTENIEMREYLNEELDKAISKVETIPMNNIMNTELKEFLNEELDNEIWKVETRNNINKELKEFISEKLEQAIKQAEIMAVVSNTNEITDAQRQIIKTEIKEIINEELNKALTLIDSDETAKSRGTVISEMKDFINEQLNSALVEVDYPTVSKDVEEMIKNSEIREFIVEELDKTINKAEKFANTPNTDDRKSVINKEIQELINDELNKTILKAGDLANFPNAIEDNKSHECDDENMSLLDSSLTTDEDICADNFEIKKPPEKEKFEVKSRSPRYFKQPKVYAKGQGEPTSPDFSEQIHKIIRRVEDIYSQLDDIQSSDSMEKIPVFKDVDLPSVQSEMFLTPFMQAVKETRKKSNDPEKETIIEKSPSYYNVMNFLDTLNNIQKEIPYEIYTTRLHNYVYVYQIATTYYQAEVWYELKFTKSCNERSSCLKSISEERRGIKTYKKVSFSQIPKMDKSSQATLCPFHKAKAVKISSQQFPPLPQVNEDEKTQLPPNDKASQSKIIIEIKKASMGHMNSDASETQCLSKYRCCVHKNQEPTPNEPHKKPCAIHGDTVKTSRPPCKRERKHCAANKEKCPKHGDCHERTKNHQLSVQGDKSTQVFCQMQKENLNHITATEQPCAASSNNESSDCPNYMEDNPDDSKSTEKDFLDNSLIDPFYDYVNENVNMEGINMQKVKDEDNTKVQAKIAVFKDAEEQNLLEPQEMVVSSNAVEIFKKKFETRREIRLLRRSSVEIARQSIPKITGNDNVILLKSFYAIVYILMFTALSLDYRCL